MQLYLYQDKYKIWNCLTEKELEDQKKKYPDDFKNLIVEPTAVNIKEDIDKCIRYRTSIGFEDIKILNKLFDIIYKTHNIKPVYGNNMDIATSSGSSAVIIVNNLDVVYQYFINKDIYFRIYGYLTDLLENSKVYDDGQSYDLFDYIAKPVKFIHSLQTIVFERLETINETKQDINYDKLRININRALRGLELIGYSHGDPRLDNIGIKSDGTYALFDFDSMKNKRKYHEDYRMFSGSIKFRTE